MRTIRTLETESVTSYAGYTPDPIDTFNIGLQKGVTLVQSYGTLPVRLYPDLMRFAARYSELGLVVLVEEMEETRYAIFQTGDRSSLEWAARALARLEDGWELQDQIAVSPNPSNLRLGTVIDTLLSATCKDTEGALKAILNR